MITVTLSCLSTALSISPIAELVLFLIVSIVETRKNSFLAGSFDRNVERPGLIIPVKVLPYSFINPTYLIDFDNSIIF
ncbi:exported hypothetical protein [Nitrosotalea sinensis]|uniref:Uncharacterized protein n=1 Tax=Nitrosotalea sinensis TaxID=1499975 RepID=A0A2H1EHX7_9ARCH|nr:exported hypothetical protein [Candidatus Nitrosotalea sinensis]